MMAKLLSSALLHAVAMSPALFKAGSIVGEHLRRRPPLEAGDDAPGSDDGALRVLLLTSSLGSGHMRAARAVEAALTAPAHAVRVRTVDFWSLMDDGVTQALHRSYLQLVQRQPGLYDRIYMLDQRTWRAVLEGERPPAALLEGLEVLAKVGRQALDACTRVTHPVDRIMFGLFCGNRGAGTPLLRAADNLLRVAIIKSGWALLVSRLDAILRTFAPDAIVATQMNPAALLQLSTQRRRLAIPVTGVLTDYGVHDFWIHPGIDHYCLPHEDVRLALTAHAPRASTYVSGIPLMPQFQQPPSQETARDQLALDRKAAVVLVAGGGLGLGVDAIVGALLAAHEHIHVLAVTGSNGEACAALQALASRMPQRLRVWAWTDDMALLMRAADLVVGKPGGLTLAEALACGRPLLATHSLRAQEDFNVRFLEQHGVGGLIPERELVRRITVLLADRATLSSVQAKAWALGKREGAERIATLVLESARVQRSRVAPGTSLEPAR
ncbi:MAG: hypothetical protein KIS79_12685 [Burkholderiales bacterium]|nr:hypothetical protein [Burkholderiales bacterium]